MSLPKASLRGRIVNDITLHAGQAEQSVEWHVSDEVTVPVACLTTDTPSKRAIGELTHITVRERLEWGFEGGRDIESGYIDHANKADEAWGNLAGPLMYQFEGILLSV